MTLRASTREMLPRALSVSAPILSPRFRSSLRFRSPLFARASKSSGINGSSHVMTTGPDSAPRPLDWVILDIAWPMLLTLAADPIAGLVDTAYIGRLGSVELAAVGVALSIFNSATKLFNVPLLSVTTSAVAAAWGAAGSQGGSGNNGAAAAPNKPLAAAPGPPGSAGTPGSSSETSSSPTAPDASAHVRGPTGPASGSSSGRLAAGSAPGSDATVDRNGVGVLLRSDSAGADAVSEAASSAVIIALSIGVVQAVLLSQGQLLLPIWGVDLGSELMQPTLDFLNVRCLGAPATVLMLALQGIFRGLQDTRTTLVATLTCNAANVVLAPLLIFTAGWGVQGAAIATVSTQVLSCAFLLHRLAGRVDLLASSTGTLSRVAAMFRPTGLLVIRTFFICLVYATSTAVVARSGAAPAAAHQVAFQVWLACSLLADSLAVAAQALLAASIAAGNASRAQQVVHRSVRMAAWLGLGLGLVLMLGRHGVARLFTSDPLVLLFISGIMPLVVLSQPINAVAFVLDGVVFGAGAFAQSCKLVAVASLPALACTAAAALSEAANWRLLWVWLGLLVLMMGRAATIFAALARASRPFSWMKAEGGGSNNGQAHSMAAEAS